ncbi:MAG: hypothetical protein U9R34_05315 [Nanoarchaeota archaeon]|nr:hypothetical protein [Nanoarchaeota archaeon]
MSITKHKKQKIRTAENTEPVFNNWRFVTKILLLLLITLFILYDTLALGISPSTREVYFEPGIEKTLSYHIINNEQKNISVSLAVSGDFKDYILLNDSIVDMLDTEEKIKLYYTLKFPQEMESGKWKSEIIATSKSSVKAGTSSGSGNTITASMSIASEISVIAASLDNYLIAELDAHDVPENEIPYFDIAMNNLKDKNLHNVFAAIIIYSPEGKPIMQFNTSMKDLKKHSKSHIQASLPANHIDNLAPGRYYANATVYYEGLAAESGDEFKIGNPEIKISEISLFKAGDNTYRFEIDTISEWNSPISQAYITLDINDIAGSLVPQLQSYLFDMEPMGNEIITIYAELEEHDEERLHNATTYVTTIAEGNSLENIYFVENILKSRIKRSLQQIKEALMSVWFRILLILILLAIAGLHIHRLYIRHNKNGNIKKNETFK